MPLDKDILGQAIYDCRVAFSNQDMDAIIATYGTLENARLAQAKAEAEVIINHIKANSLIKIPGTGLLAGSVPITGIAITGTIE